VSSRRLPVAVGANFTLTVHEPFAAIDEPQCCLAEVAAAAMDEPPPPSRRLETSRWRRWSCRHDRAEAQRARLP